MNARVNLPGIQKIMMEFDKQNQMMEMKEEMMSDSMDAAFDEEGVEEESEEIVSKVLDEIGINLNESVCLACDSPPSVLYLFSLLHFCRWPQHQVII